MNAMQCHTAARMQLLGELKSIKTIHNSMVISECPDMKGIIGTEDFNIFIGTKDENILGILFFFFFIKSQKI